MDVARQALDLLEQRALNRRRVDWPALRRDLPADPHTAIRTAITALGDPHTFLLTAADLAEAFGDEAVQNSLMPSGEIVGERFALIRIPETPSVDEADLRYTRTGAALVRDLDGQRPDGWIVDLRGNTGGNMYPMLTVLAPLLGDGVLGSFVDADGESAGQWILRDGVVHQDDEPLSPEPHPHRLATAGPPIAVLTDGDTMSAGEATLIAFRGLPDVRTFGAPTAGLATGNAAHELADGSMLVLTEVRESDRAGRLFGTDPIVPDEPAHDALQAAVTWLESRSEGA
ncbi:S41 family peptidase [Actinoplanes couchii]|uniref:Peptidase S41 n=1 Tax=Actinoplanes couchii TaxID=403638 RepID=A0ABQ3XKQ5_9ACTN|nr:S41 family peptidase [Actinoplanes couchii]MDR6319536.1 C-terminal processing protease CtpA/Prc [Actinoplanes couchii]GID59074.1 peptidase S41 [Actinoplanes couchii]